MKRFIQAALTLLVVAALASSCGVVAKTAGVDRSRFVGTWTVTDVTYDGVLRNAVSKIFDQAPPQDFVGSSWQLTNSGNAAYTLTNGTSQSIYWSYYNPGAGVQPLFQFKKVYQGDKAKNVELGYRLVIAGVDNTTMTLKVPVDMGAQTGYVVLTFIKK